MLVLIAILSQTVSSLNLIDYEISTTLTLISLIEEKILSLNALHSSLLSTNTSIPDERSWQSWLDTSLTFPNRFHLQSHSSFAKTLLNSDFLPFKQFSSPGFISCFSDGDIFVYSNTQVLTQFNTGLKTKYCATSYSSEEILIGSVDSNYLRVHKVNYNESAGYPVQLLVDAKFESEEVFPTAFTQYTRLNNQFWVLGDSFGFLTVYASNGEVFGKVYGKVGQIGEVLKLGQQLVYYGKRKIAVFNTGSMDVTSMCEAVDDIFKVTIDQTTAIVHASLVTGEILTFDTRFSIGNGPTFCKVIYRNFAKFPGHLAAVKGSLLLLSSNSLVAFNTSYLEIDTTMPPEYFLLPISDSQTIKSYQVAECNIVMISGTDEIRVYMIRPPEYIPLAVPGSGFDFGFLRIVAVVLIVVFFVFWKSKNGTSKKDLEVEKLERSLEELQRSMESTTSMSEELTSRFRNAEESTKHLGGLRSVNEDFD